MVRKEQGSFVAFMRTLETLVCMLVCVFGVGMSLAWAGSQSEEVKSRPDKSLLASTSLSVSETDFSSTPVRKRPKFMGNTRDVQNTFTLEPVGFLFGTATVEYELMLFKNFSLAAGYKFNRPGAETFLLANSRKHTYWGYQGSIRFYPLGKFYAPRGLWLGTTVEHISDHYDQYNGTVFYTNALAEAGFGFMFNDLRGIFISPFIDLGYSGGGGDPIMKEPDYQIAPFSGVTGVLRVRVGLGF